VTESDVDWTAVQVWVQGVKNSWYPDPVGTVGVLWVGGTGNVEIAVLMLTFIRGYLNVNFLLFWKHMCLHLENWSLLT
jgi:hypothetical protein